MHKIKIADAIVEQFVTEKDVLIVCRESENWHHDNMVLPAKANTIANTSSVAGQLLVAQTSISGRRYSLRISH